MTATTIAPGRVARAVRPAGARSRASRARTLTALAFCAPTIAGLVIFFAYPFVANIGYSFTRYDLVSEPQWIGLRNYVYLFTQDPLVIKAAGNTLWFVIVLVPVRVVTALGIAGLLVRARHASSVWRTIFYLPSLVPPAAAVVAFVFLLNPGSGPVNQVLELFGISGPLWFNDPAWAKPSLVLLGVWVMGDIMVIFLASLLDVPTQQYEAASLDGANGAQKLWHITLPALRPVLLFALITGVIIALQYFTEAAIASGVASGKAVVGGGGGGVMGYPENSLLTYTLWLYVRGFANYQLGYAAALAVVLFVLAGAFVLVLLRRLNAFTPEVAR